MTYQSQFLKSLQPKRRPLSEKETAEMNLTCAPVVNMIYALGIIIEGLSLDLKDDSLYNAACTLREQVHEVNNNVSESFGDWAEEVEDVLVSLAPKRELLSFLCAKIYGLSLEMERYYRRFDPKFDFYQMAEILEIYKHSKQFTKHTAKRVNASIAELMAA